MQEYEQAVLISYAWGGESEEIVNQVDEALQKRGIKIIRDKRDLGYKGSINSFMERIGEGNCVIVVISDKYLRSPNCMFELVEFADNKQFHERIFPIVLGDADIYDPVKWSRYIKHWKGKKEELEKTIKTMDLTITKGMQEELDLYVRILRKIDGLVSTLKDMNALNPDMHRDSNFSDLYDSIVKRMQEIPAKPSAETKRDEITSKSAVDAEKTVTAANGSIGIGSINIGGDASGNIIIGNDNQVKSGNES